MNKLHRVTRTPLNLSYYSKVKQKSQRKNTAFYVTGECGRMDFVICTYVKHAI
jgi:hypothetical protein